LATIVTSCVPSNNTLPWRSPLRLILLAVDSFCADVAVISPTKELAVIVLAVKLPNESRETMVLTVLALVAASTFDV